MPAKIIPAAPPSQSDAPVAHTPGPWSVSPEMLRYNCQIVVLGPAGRLISDASPVALRSDAEIGANARLIAAAPELLLACKELLVYLAELGTVAGHDLSRGKPTERAWAAIVKAERLEREGAS